MGRSRPSRPRLSLPTVVALVAVPALVALVAGYIRLVVVPQERTLAETAWKGIVRTTAVHWQIALGSWLDWLEGEAKALGSQPILSAALAKKQGSVGDATRALEAARVEHRLASIQLLDGNALPVIETSAPGLELESREALAQLVLASKEPRRLVSQTADGMGVVSWAMPVAGERPGQVAGVLVVQARLWEGLLSRLDCAWGTSASIECAVFVREGPKVMRLLRPGRGDASATAGKAAERGVVEPFIFDEPVGQSLVGVFPSSGGRDSLVAAYRLPDPVFAVAVSVDRMDVWQTGSDMVRKRSWAAWFVVLCALVAGLTLLRAQHIKHEGELALRESRFSAVLSQANDVILFVGIDGKILDANQKAEAIYGRTRAELQSMTVSDLRTPETSPSAMSILQKASVEGSLVWETVHRDRNGKQIPFEVSGRLVKEGETEFIVAILRDISERKKAERAVQAAQAEIRKLSLAVEQSPVGVMITSRDGQIEYVNRRFCEMTGYTREEAIGRNPRILKSGAQEPRVYWELWQAILAGHEWRGELVNRRKSGERYWESILIAPIVEGGGIRHFIAIKEDVSEKKRSEEALRESQRQLLHAQKMEAVGRLAGGVAHDFNNLLSVILGYAELAEDALTASDPVRRNVGEIRKAGQRAASLTRQLLAFSRKQIRETQVVDLDQIVREMRRMLARLIGEDVQLDVRVEAEPATILADPGQVEQAILNLAVNARDAMPDGGKVTIRSTNEEIDEARANLLSLGKPGPYVVLTVSDTGHGIPLEIQPKVFEPFFTTKEPGKGTGLGLSMVYGIVKQNGGGVSLESEEGAGAAFRLYFPAVAAAAAGAPREESIADAPGGTETVLLVEDDGPLRRMTAETLRSRGYNVLVAAESREALTLAEKDADGIQLLLTDLVMPGGSGQDLAQKLIEKRPGVKVLLVSGYSADVAAVEAAIDSGMAFMQKPYTSAALLKKIREVLGRPAAS